MKSKIEKTRMCSAFTIVELLTVMSIIIILIGILIPGLNQIRRYALFVKQKNQLSAISKALEFFNVENQGYPDSGAFDKNGVPYCGAMKLCEAMLGQDLRGFNPDSRFFQIGTTDGNPPIPNTPISAGGNDLYPDRHCDSRGILSRGTQNQVNSSIRERKGLYLESEAANAYKISELFYDMDKINSVFQNPQASTLPILCDVYGRVQNVGTGKSIGMPILYYKANTTNLFHAPSLMVQELARNIYNSFDNQMLIDFGLPWDPLHAHPLATAGGLPTPDEFATDPRAFYEQTRNPDFSAQSARPYKADSFILMSAGFDGLYGTKDDVFDFEKR